MTLESFISRHGEAAVAGMLENWERFAGLRSEVARSVEDRWQAFMAETPAPLHMAMTY